MAIVNGYATSAEFQTRTGLTDAELAAKLALIELEIEANSRMIDLITGNIFYALTLTDVSVYYDSGISASGMYMAEDAQRVYFPGPIITLTSVKSNNEALTVNEEYYARTDFIRSSGVFSTEQEYGVQITGSCGYAATPKDVKEICLAMTEVSTGLGTYTMLDSAGGKVEVTRDNLPDWVAERLFMRIRFDNYG